MEKIGDGITINKLINTMIVGFKFDMPFKSINEIIFGYKKALTTNASYVIDKNKRISIWKDNEFSFINLDTLQSNNYLKNINSRYNNIMGLSWDIIFNNYTLKK